MLPFRGSLLFVALFCLCSSANGQMVTGSFPLVGARNSFFEGISLNGGFRGGGVISPFNRFGGGIPPFGGFNPNAGLSGGFGINTGPFSANLGFNFAQGASRSMVSNTPMVTGFNGVPLMLQNTVQRPFVTSLIPNVGSGAVFQDFGAANTIRGRMLRGEFTMRDGKVVPAGGSKPRERTAEAPARPADHRPLVNAAPPTRAEREARLDAKQAEKQLAIRNYLKKGQDAEAAGKLNVAKLYYQMAARRAEGELKQKAVALLDRVAE